MGNGPAEFTVGELQPGIERGYQLLVGAHAVDPSVAEKISYAAVERL